MIILRVIPGGGLGFERALEAEEVIIGRSAKCNLTIPDLSLSREHARLFRRDADWLVEDLGSRNGTFLNGQRVIGPLLIGSGDGLALGDSVILIEALPSRESSSPNLLDTGAILRPAAELLNTLAPTARDREPAPSHLLDRYARRLRLMQEMHQALARTAGVADLLELVLDRTFLHLRPDEAAIFLRSADGAVERAAGRSVHPGGMTDFSSRTLVREVIEKGQAALVQDVSLDGRFDRASSIVQAGVRSLLAAPLMDADGTLGMIVLWSRAAVRQFDEGDMELLAFMASTAALRIRTLLLAGEAEKRRIMENELLLARRIQEAVLTKRLPDLPGHGLHVLSQPSRVVSGDLCQVLLRNGEGECVLFVADVSGKGISAALLTTSLEALCAVPIGAGSPPEEVFSRVSALLHRRTSPADYATAFLAVLERATGRLRYASAGHCPPLLLRNAGGEEWLESTGPPLGLLMDAAYAARETLLGPGDTLLLYTDGITEAVSSTGEEYGEDRLADACRRERGLPPEALAEALQRDLEAFTEGLPFADDRTLVILRKDGQE